MPLEIQQFECWIFTYITEIGSIYPRQDKLRPVHNQGEFSETFFSILLVEPLQVKLQH